MDAKEWDQRYADSELVWSAGPNQFVEAELAGLTPGRAVDLAAGEGRNANWLAARGWKVTAVDFSAAGLAKGRRVQPPGTYVEWVCADVLTWEAGGEFDLALMTYLQLRDDERRLAVSHAFDALRAGGTLFVVGHDTTNLTEGSGGPSDASVLFTAEDVLADLAGRELEVQRAERVARVVQVADEHGSDAETTAYDALVRIRRTG